MPLVVPKRHRLAKENVRHAFPGMIPRRRAQIVRAMWGHLGRVAAEFAKIPQLTSTTVGRYVALVDFHHVDRALALGRGVIFLTAHCGNWELMAQGVVIKGYRVAVVVRPLHHPVVDRLVNGIRAAHGIVVIPHRQAVREGVRRLRQNWTLGILMDQAFPGGLPVRFFGRWASTTSIISQLAHRTGAAVIPVHSYRERDKIYAVAEPPVALDTSQAGERAVQADIEQFTQRIEGWVQAHPEQWLWVHNRWKGHPPLAEMGTAQERVREPLPVTRDSA